MKTRILLLLVALLLTGGTPFFEAAAQSQPLGKLRATSAEATPETKALSQWLTVLQNGLSKNFGINRVHVGGGSSRALLDHIYFGAPLTMRDFDVLVVADRQIDRAYAEKVARTLESPELGRFSESDLRPRPRVNPALPRAEGFSYNAGFGFFWLRNRDILDISMYHTPQDLALNGILDIDAIMIAIDKGMTLEDFVREARRTSYSELVRSGRIVDVHGGYQSWTDKTARVIHPLEIVKDPVVISIRLVRSFSKLGQDSLPEEMKNVIWGAVAKTEDPNRLQLVRNLEKLLEDKKAAAELKVLAEIGILGLWSQVLAQEITATPVETLKRRLQGAAVPSDRGPPGSPDPIISSLLGLVSPTEQIHLLRDVKLVHPEWATQKTTTLMNKLFEQTLKMGPVSLDTKLIESVLNNKDFNFDFTTEAGRIVKSIVLSEEEKGELMLRAFLRRLPLADRDRTLREIAPKLSAARHAEVLHSAGQKRKAFLSGVFNPFHRGHEEVIRRTIEHGVCDEFYVIPTPATTHNERPIEWSHRLEIAQLGTKHIVGAHVISEDYLPELEINTFKGITRLVNTVGAKDQWIHVMGADSFERYQAAGRLNPQNPFELFIVSRPGTELGLDPEKLGPKVRWFNAAKTDSYSEDNRSSNQVRQLRLEGKPITGLVTAEVAAYIQQNDLYASATPSVPDVPRSNRSNLKIMTCMDLFSVSAR